MIPRFKPQIGWKEILVLISRNYNAVKLFEKKFAAAFQAVDAVTFPYGRSAQWAFFKALGIQDSEIIMPAYTCSVVAHAVTLSGNKPRLIDIDLHDYNMNLEAAELAINEKTRAIVATHTFGYPQNLDRLEDMVKRGEEKYGHKIWLMQDCCHAFGAKWNGRLIGSSGDVSVYAFNISKLMTTIFGGILTFQDQKLADQVRKWRDKNYKKPSIKKSLSRRFYLLAVYIAFIEPIYSFTLWIEKHTSLLDHLTKSYHRDNKIHFPPDYLDLMLNVEAAVGLIQLQRYNSIVEHRTKNAIWYDRYLKKQPDYIYPPIVEGATYSHYVVRVSNRQAFVRHWALKGIQMGELIQYSIDKLPEYQYLSQEDAVNSHLASLTTVNYPLTTSTFRLKKFFT